MENNEVKNELVLGGFNNLVNKNETKMNIYTNITDNKKIYNLDNHVDFKLNDCKGETIIVKEVLVKIIEKLLDEPITNEDGEVIEKEYKKICILIDKDDKSYVTASKMFTNQMVRYIATFGLDEPIAIRIIEKSVRNSSNKALGFELV